MNTSQANPWQIKTTPIAGGLFGYRWEATNALTGYRATGTATTDKRAQEKAWEALRAELLSSHGVGPDGKVVRGA